jgi:hypothetical protein
VGNSTENRLPEQASCCRNCKARGAKIPSSTTGEQIALAKPELGLFQGAAVFQGAAARARAAAKPKEEEAEAVTS